MPAEWAEIVVRIGRELPRYENERSGSTAWL